MPGRKVTYEEEFSPAGPVKVTRVTKVGTSFEIANKEYGDGDATTVWATVEGTLSRGCEDNVDAVASTIAGLDEMNHSTAMVELEGLTEELAELLPEKTPKKGR